MRKEFLLVLLLFPLLLFGVTDDPAALWLSWKKDPTRSMVIQWITPPSEQETRLEFRRLEEGGWQKVRGEVFHLPRKYDDLVHRVELQNLIPDTIYQFRLSRHGPLFKFRTLPTDLTLRFVVGGDMYHDSVEDMEKTSRVAASTDPHFALIGGDIAYSGSRFWFIPENGKRWFDWLESWKRAMITPDGYLIPVVPAIGNHEVNGRYGQTPNQAKFFYTLFPLPEGKSYRFLNIGNQIGIWILDTDHTNAIVGEQTEWLEKSLKEHQKLPFKFALYHVPGYPSARKFKTIRGERIRHNWVPLFEKYGVDIAFENHDHTYKRTVRLKEGKKDPQGVLYVGDGGWGVDKPRKKHRNSWYLEKFASDRNFVLGEFRDGRLSFEAFNDTGEQLDFFK